jgi:hypothetical protein
MKVFGIFGVVIGVPFLHIHWLFSKQLNSLFYFYVYIEGSLPPQEP